MSCKKQCSIISLLISGSPFGFSGSYSPLSQNSNLASFSGPYPCCRITCPASRHAAYFGVLCIHHSFLKGSLELLDCSLPSPRKVSEPCFSHWPTLQSRERGCIWLCPQDLGRDAVLFIATVLLFLGFLRSQTGFPPALPPRQLQDLLENLGSSERDKELAPLSPLLASLRWAE